MRQVLLALSLLFTSPMALALTPADIAEWSEIELIGHMPCTEPESGELHHCREARKNGHLFRAMTKVPHPDAEVIRVFTPPNEEYPTGEMTVGELEAKHADFI